MLKLQLCVNIILGTSIYVDYKNYYYYADGDDFLLYMNNLTYAAGTEPLGPDSQMCLNISIIDDDLYEGIEQFVICGSSEQSIEFEGNECIDIFIEDNDGMKIIAARIYEQVEMTILSHSCQFHILPAHLQYTC